LYTLAPIPAAFYLVASPVFILSVGSILAMLMSVCGNWNRPRLNFGFLFLVLGLAFAAVVRNGPHPHVFFEGAFQWSGISYVGSLLLLGIAGILAALFYPSYLRDRFFTGEVTALYLLTLLGMVVLLASNDFVTILIGLELSAMGLYALVGYVDVNRLSLEGAVKYLVLGSVATAVFLFGTGLLYLSTGALDLPAMGRPVADSMQIWMQTGMFMVFLGLSFKLALVPFHSWTPDVYEGAPSGITALMATCVKIAILLLLFRVCGFFLHAHPQWNGLFLYLSAFSILIGNWLALVQSGLKRMLAYSSIAHSGYMVMLLSVDPQGTTLPIAIFYLLGYSLATLVIFGVMMWLEEKNCRNLHLDDIAGLGRKYPLASLALTVAILSLAGMPPTVGFLGKFLLFTQALQGEQVVLVILAALGSALSLYYYLRVLVRMYMYEPDPISLLSPQRSWITIGVVGASVLLLVLMGTVLTQPVLSWLSLKVLV
jgi:NADH-quinone oxidoreductase subunit N